MKLHIPAATSLFFVLTSFAATADEAKPPKVASSVPAVVSSQKTGEVPLSTSSSYSALIFGKSEITVKAKSQGEVAELKRQEGQEVKQGDVIAIIDDRQEKIDQVLADSELKVAQQDYEKTASLKKFVSTEEIQQKKSAYLKKQSVFDLKSLDLANTRVVSPIDGVITRSYFERGETVSVGEKMFEVVRMDELVLVASVPAKEIERFKKGATVPFTVEGRQGLYQAIVTFLSPVIDPSSDTVRVKLSAKNPKVAGGEASDYELLPGMMASLKP